jgi:hypothetical protein
VVAAAGVAVGEAEAEGEGEAGDDNGDGAEPELPSVGDVVFVIFEEGVWWARGGKGT